MNDTLISLEERAGTDIKNIDSLDSLITKAGFDFEVEKAQLYSPEGGEVDNMFMLRRKDTKVPLNVVRGRYQLVHNREMLEPFDNGEGVWSNVRKRRDGRSWPSLLG